MTISSALFVISENLGAALTSGDVPILSKLAATAHSKPSTKIRIWNEGEHYYLQDANFNVTAVTDNTGAVKERYAYTPYGEVSILDASFTAVSNNVSTISNEHLYTGRRRDPETGLQLNRNRFYASHLGRWVNRDPIGYAGGYNLYEYVLGRPTYYVDPSGECGGLCIGGGILIGIWLGSQTGCEVPHIDRPPPQEPPEEPPEESPPEDRGRDGPCEGNSNKCCNEGNKTYNRPNPNWPFPGSEHLPIPGQGGANKIAKAGGCASCNQGLSNFIEKCESCCLAVGGGLSAQSACKITCQNAANKNAAK